MWGKLTEPLSRTYPSGKSGPILTNSEFLKASPKLFLGDCFCLSSFIYIFKFTACHGWLPTITVNLMKSKYVWYKFGRQTKTLFQTEKKTGKSWSINIMNLINKALFLP